MIDTIPPSFLLTCYLIDMGKESKADLDLIALFAGITGFTEHG